MPSKNPRINVVLDDNLYKNIQFLAETEGVSLSAKVKELIKEGIVLGLMKQRSHHSQGCFPFILLIKNLSHSIDGGVIVEVVLVLLGKFLVLPYSFRKIFHEIEVFRF